MDSSAATDAITFPSKLQMWVIRCLQAQPVPADNLELQRELVHMLCRCGLSFFALFFSSGTYNTVSQHSFLPRPSDIEVCLASQDKTPKVLRHGKASVGAHVFQLLKASICGDGSATATPCLAELRRSVMDGIVEVCNRVGHDPATHTHTHTHTHTQQHLRSALMTRHLTNKKFAMWEGATDVLGDILSAVLPSYEPGSAELARLWTGLLRMVRDYLQFNKGDDYGMLCFGCLWPRTLDVVTLHCASNTSSPHRCSRVSVRLGRRCERRGREVRRPSAQRGAKRAAALFRAARRDRCAARHAGNRRVVQQTQARRTCLVGYVREDPPPSPTRGERSTCHTHSHRRCHATPLRPVRHVQYLQREGRRGVAGDREGCHPPCRRAVQPGTSVLSPPRATRAGTHTHLQILDDYIADDKQQGRCPLPQYRRDEVVGVLTKLATSHFCMFSVHTSLYTSAARVSSQPHRRPPQPPCSSKACKAPTRPRCGPRVLLPSARRGSRCVCSPR